MGCLIVSDDINVLMDRLEARLGDMPRQMGVARFWSEGGHVKFDRAWEAWIKDSGLDGKRRWSEQDEGGEGKESLLNKLFDKVAKAYTPGNRMAGDTLPDQLNLILRPFADPLAELEETSTDASHYKKAFSIVMPLLSNDDAFKSNTVRLPDIISEIDPELMRPGTMGPAATYNANAAEESPNTMLEKTILNDLSLQKGKRPHVSKDNKYLEFTMSPSVVYTHVTKGPSQVAGGALAAAERAAAEGSGEDASSTTEQEWARAVMLVTYRVPLGMGAAPFAAVEKVSAEDESKDESKDHLGSGPFVGDNAGVLALYGPVNAVFHQNLEKAAGVYKAVAPAAPASEPAAKAFLSNVAASAQTASKKLNPYGNMYTDMRKHERKAMQYHREGEMLKFRSVSTRKRLTNRSLLKALDGYSGQPIPKKRSERAGKVQLTLIRADLAYQKHFIQDKPLSDDDKKNLRAGEEIRVRIHKEYRREGLTSFDRFDRGKGYRKITEGMVHSAKEIQKVVGPMSPVQDKTQRKPAASNRGNPIVKLTRRFFGTGSKKSGG